MYALATEVLFQSAVQHFALAPNNLTDAPEWAINFMKTVPTTWDEIRFIDGYPSKYVVLARLHGYQRVTMDVDVVLAMDGENLQRFVTCAKSAGLQPVIPVDIESLARPELLDQWHREKGMLAFGLRRRDGMAPIIDVLIRPIVPFEQLRRDAVSVEVGPLKIPVASIDHLIAMKTGTGRGKDKIDIEELQKLKSGGAS